MLIIEGNIVKVLEFLDKAVNQFIVDVLQNVDNKYDPIYILFEPIQFEEYESCQQNVALVSIMWKT